MSIHSLSQKLGARMIPDEPFDIESWRNWFSRVVLIIVVVGFPLALVVTLPVFIAERRFGLVALDVIFWLFLAVRLFSRSSTYRANAFLFLAVLYALMISFFVSLGPVHARPAWLVMCAVLASLFFSVRGAALATAANAMILLFIYFVLEPENAVWAAEYQVPTGKWIMFVVNVSFLTLAASLPVGFMFERLSRSLKQERDAHERLTREQDKFKLLTEDIVDNIWVINPSNYRFVYVSPSIERMLGYKPEEAVGMKMDEFLTPASFELVMKKILSEISADSGEQPEPGTVELEAVRKDGSIIWAELSAKFVNLGWLSSRAILGVARDITERKEAEEARNSMEKNYREVFNATSEAIFIHDEENGKILDVNQSVLDMYGYSYEEIQGLTVHDLSSGESPFSQTEADRKIGKAVAEGPQVFDWRSKKKNGEHFWTSVCLKSSRIGGRGRVLAAVRDITDRKEAEERLRFSESRLKDIFDTSFDGILLHQEGKLIDINVKASLQLGYSRNELLKMSLYDLIAKEELEATLERFKMVSQKPELQYRGVETKFVRKDGTETDVEYFSRTTVYEGVPVRIIAFRDISDRKKAENALKESELRYRMLFESAGEAIFIIKDDIFVNCNPKTLEIFECPAERIIGCSPHHFSPDYQPDGSESKHKAAGKISAARAGKPQFFEWEHTKYDGTPFDAEVSLHAIELGGAVYVQAMVRDITERKRVVDKLKESEARQALLLRSLPMVFYIAQPFGEFGGDWVSDQIYQISGFTAEEFVQDEAFWASRLHPDDRQRVLEAFDSLIELGTTTTEYRWQVSDRSYKWFQDNAVLLSDESDKPKVVIGTWLDITEQKMMKTQLQQAQKMEAIGTLAGGIAHDFNNILGAILGYAELIKMFDAPEGGSVHERLDHIINSSYRAKDLVQQILTFSRKTDEEKKPTRIIPLVKETLKFLRASIPSTIEITEQYELENGMVLGDPTQLHQVLMNLCTNAAYAMRGPGGGLQVILTDVDFGANEPSQRLDLKPGSYISLTIKDEGSGMSPEVMERIFEPFFTTKEKGEGTGLGLSVVHSIVKGMGGTITVESEVGKGTCFRVYLPTIDGEVSGEDAIKPETVPTGSERIFFVDDEKAIVDFAQEVLVALGYRVVTGTDSAAAMDILSEHSDEFDLVVTDLTMPEITGLKLAEKIRGFRIDLPIILCSGFLDSSAMQKAKELNIDAVLPKPVGATQLAQKIRAVLDRQQKGK